MKTFGANELPDMSAAYAEIQEKSKKRWQDDDGDGKWYEKSDVDGKISKREKEAQEKKLKKEDVQAEGHQRDPDQQKKDRHHSKQPDPSKDGFTGIGNMSIDDIMNMNKKIKAKESKKSKKEEVENDAQEITEISADLALKASKKAEVERGKAAVAGNREKAVAKLKQSSRLYAKQAAKRRKENAGG